MAEDSLTDRYVANREEAQIQAVLDMFLALGQGARQKFLVRAHEQSHIDSPTSIDLVQPGYVDAVTQGGDRTFPALPAPKVCPLCEYVGVEALCPNDGEELVESRHLPGLFKEKGNG